MKAKLHHEERERENRQRERASEKNFLIGFSVLSLESDELRWDWDVNQAEEGVN